MLPGSHLRVSLESLTVREVAGNLYSLGRVKQNQKHNLLYLPYFLLFALWYIPFQGLVIEIQGSEESL